MALGSVAVFVLIFLLLFIMRPFGESRGQMHSIAVMPFSYEGEEDDWRWLSAAATDLINSELERYPSVQVLRAQKRLQVMRKLGIESEKLDRSSALKIASAANMSSVLVGGLRKQGDSIRLQGQILATDTGKLIEELEPVEDEHIRLHELAGTFSSRLVKWMKVEIPSESRANRPGTRAPVSLDALRYYIEGRDAAYDLRYAEGIAKLSKAISLDSTFIRPYYLLAWQYESIGNKAKAKEVLTRGKPHIANLPLDKRLEYLCQEANIEDRWQDYANYLEQLLRLRPGKASLHFRYGMTQYTHFRNVDAGIAAMQKSLQLDSTYSYAYNALGYAYLARGDKKKAVEMLQKYVALKPSGVNPLESLAEIFELIGRYDEAIALCQRIKALQPDFPYLPIRLARVYISLGRYARALEVLDESVPQSPKFESIAQSLRAELYFRRDEFEKALVFAVQAITLDPGNLDGHWMHGRILLRLGKEEAFKKELALLRRAVEKKRSLKNRWLLDHLEGEYAHQRDDFGRAIESFQSALGLMPLDRSFYRAALANAYVKSGQLNKAVAQYKLATRFNPNAAQACFELARTYEHLGNLSKASRYYKKVLDIWSDADKEIKQLVATKKKIATFELSSKER